MTWEKIFCKAKKPGVFRAFLLGDRGNIIKKKGGEKQSVFTAFAACTCAA